MLKYVFVFTPERLISYLGEKENPVINYVNVIENEGYVSLKFTNVGWKELFIAHPIIREFFQKIG